VTPITPDVRGVIAITPITPDVKGVIGREGEIKWRCL